jgi:hypothetical protein
MLVFFNNLVMVLVSFHTFVNVAHYCFCIMLGVFFLSCFVLCLGMCVVGKCYFAILFLCVVFPGVCYWLKLGACSFCQLRNGLLHFCVRWDDTSRYV